MNYAVILASGTGQRAGFETPKQYIKINGKTILEYTIDAFENNLLTDRIILVVSKEYLDFCANFKFKKLYKIVQGGSSRRESSRNGVRTIEENDANVLIHDGARCFVSDEIINRCYEALKTHNAVNTGIETADTIIEVNEENIITNIPKRSSLLRCQTPQGFKSGLIKEAHEKTLEKGISVTDDTGLIVSLGLDEVFVVKGDVTNIKITYPKDIEEAKKAFS